MRRVVAVVARPHGVRGEVALRARTDVPQERFRPGASLFVEPASTADQSVADPPVPVKLTVLAVRVHQQRWLVRFDEVSSRDEAERLRGCTLSVDVDARADDPPESGGDVFADHLLEGLAILDVDSGHRLGAVLRVVHLPAQDVLEVRPTHPAPTPTVLLPFVRALVPEVDLERGVLLARPPGGLFDDLEGAD